MSRVKLMQGNEACVEGALVSGMRFFAGYPITPSTEIAEICSLRLPMVGGHFIQMEDEMASMAAVIGASVAGVKAMTATSGPGFSLKQENIGYASAAEIPCVIVNVQRSGPSTGLPTSPSQGDVMQCRWGTHGDHPIIVVSPSSVEETYNLIGRAFRLAEKYRVPVIFLMDEMIAHLREGVNISADETVCEEKDFSKASLKNYKPYKVADNEAVPEFVPFGKGARYNITGLAHDENGFPTNDHMVADKWLKRLMSKIEDNVDDICSVESCQTEDADIVLICYGGTARSAMAAVNAARTEGLRVGMLRPVTIWPFPEKAVKALSASKLIVVEHNHGQIVHEVERIVGSSKTVSFVGRVDGTVIQPNEILDAIRKA